MTKIVIAGSHGRVGKALLSLAPQFPQLEIVGEINRGSDFNSIISSCDVVIDFSVHQATLDLAKICAKNQKPIVIGTTGHTDSEKTQIANFKTQIPIVWSSNFSIGVNALFGIVGKMTEVLGSEFDIEILEMHHNRKKDAPSGTANTFLEILSKVRQEQLGGTKVVPQHGRKGNDNVRKSTEIGLHAVRGGDVICDHTIVFAGPCDVVELKQRVTNRETFARGAFRAALWLADRNPGLYDMLDVLGFNDMVPQHEEESYYSEPVRELVTH
jgi:4-hydroxy-tetrahydrodipicolinate reductase